jgi:hypothetical protein
MKVFVWDHVSDLTENYHSGGGLIVFAEDEERAMKLAQAKGVVFDGETPVDVRDVDGGEEAVYVMQDAGCC